MNAEGQLPDNERVEVIGARAMEAMETVTDLFGEDARIRVAAVAVEVDCPSTTAIIWKCSDDRPWVCEKFLQEASDAIHRAIDDEIERSHRERLDEEE